MPRGPLTPELVEFVKAPRPAVVATVGPDGTPATTATWYDWSEGRLLLSMTASGPRIRNVRANPNIALTVLGDSWYTHVSIGAYVVEVREDDGLADLDRLAQRYWGRPYAKRDLVCVTALAEVKRWHSWGDPGAQSGAA